MFGGFGVEGVPGVKGVSGVKGVPGMKVGVNGVPGVNVGVCGVPVMMIWWGYQGVKVKGTGVLTVVTTGQEKLGTLWTGPMHSLAMEGTDPAIA